MYLPAPSSILVSRYRDRDVEDEARELVKEVKKGR